MNYEGRLRKSESLSQFNIKNPVVLTSEHNLKEPIKQLRYISQEFYSSNNPHRGEQDLTRDLCRTIRQWSLDKLDINDL